MNTLDLNDAVFIQNQQIKTDSLKVAKYFGKLHKNVIRDIENLIAELPEDLRGLNFELTSTTVEMPNNASRQDKIYEMTKDGFTLLAMGFTGKKALDFKVAYINAFNQMAATLYNLQHNPNQLHIGAKVQLNSGSPLFTITKFNHDAQGIIQDAEVIWYTRNKIHRETLPLQCLTLDQNNLIHQQTLDSFWSAIYNYGLDKLNHSRKPHNIALSLVNLYQIIEGLPPRPQLTTALLNSHQPHPVFMQSNQAVSSRLTGKTCKCWVFSTPKNMIEHQGE
ncbi:Rha family transcriptional regulator [Acinetobacter qingfengensis]|uniref:Rha family transcriptional regulator n=1 Tax=Acinetobacter qingfengensis TaxID=1262585 RepID=A0A1E7R2Q3_9GAMM|nr:Rha family transcriptional regulator [Acinetobacter qingfengensis]KAA8733879.1 Rha family transcriptional regulator [Acinetobacter qingfengensis]OEY93609.1 Rha family transcriptional regulator [Acinetobacter qingfengensis]